MFRRNFLTAAVASVAGWWQGKHKSELPPLMDVNEWAAARIIDYVFRIPLNIIRLVVVLDNKKVQSFPAIIDQESDQRDGYAAAYRFILSRQAEEWIRCHYPNAKILAAFFQDSTVESLRESVCMDRDSRECDICHKTTTRWGIYVTHTLDGDSKIVTRHKRTRCSACALALANQES